MLATRFNNSSTTNNVAALLKLIQDQNCEEVRLFASPASVTPDFTDSDGPDTNLPLVAALAKYRIPGISDVYVLFDGLFLTAARRPRLGEVQTILDAAQVSGKTVFSPVTAPFTSSLDAVAAVSTLLALSPTATLTPASRVQYFTHLSSISESNYPG